MMMSFYTRALLVSLLSVIFSNLYSQDKYIKDPNFNAAFQTNKFFIDGKQEIDFSISQPDGKILVVYKTFIPVPGGDIYNMVRINPDNSIDPTFTTAVFNRFVKSVALQSDGKILVGGGFTSHNNVVSKYIVRLNTNGTKDSTFNIGNFSFPQFTDDPSVNKVAVLPGDKILLGGNFITYNGATKKYVLKLNTNGSIDSSFDFDYTGYDSDVSNFELQPDGKIITTYYFNRILRHNVNGSADTTFTQPDYSNFSGVGIKTVAVRNDGKIYIGGKFIFGGNNQFLMRLNADGTRDMGFVVKSFYQNYPSGTGVDGVYSILIQPDGKALIGGGFKSYGGQPAAGIMRLNDDGSLDSTFQGKVTRLINGYAFTDYINNLSFHSSGNVIASGSMKYYNDDVAGNIVMFSLLAGDRISTFQNICKGFDTAPNKIFMQPDGKIILTGNFYAYNGQPRDRIVRLNADGSVDNNFKVYSPLLFHSSQEPADIKFLSNGKILLGTEGTINGGENGGGLVRLNYDGSLDPTFFSLVGNDRGLYGSLKFKNFILLNDNKAVVPAMNYYVKNNVSVPIDNKFVVLDQTGNIDTAIDYAEPYNSINRLKLLSNGKILLTGYDSNLSKFLMARLLPNGQIDGAFTTVTSQPNINDMYPAPDGKIYAISNQLAGHKLMRFNEDGTLDSSFTSPFYDNGMLTRELPFEFENNGKFFTAFSPLFNYKGLVRHNADGTVDTTFDIGTGFVTTYPNNYTDDVTSIKQQGNGFLVGGEFREFDGQPVRGLVRLIPQTSLHIKEEKLVKNNFIYPNPTTGILNVKTEGFNQYQIVDNLGRVVIRSTELKSTIDVSHLPVGIYYIYLKGNKENFVEKFIKK
ncbi:T9SS type A sorting domain-containing protein [Chryseobacterium sp. JV558]|uniref:T9SS type A sorting domain-containing protein n=1 Tax=Chryseobacterium sp. JV558 TaxID=2663236 RepID=UPI00299F460E|nr:T9SS type A sorting domain-containing protein [Chryseobacterium sp. JV558]MDW9378640.1 T9SS type A sorting domain-containing protein [Chryseobacterium sp. JV558]